MSETTQAKSVTCLQSARSLITLNTIEAKAAFCLYLIDSATESPFSFVDIDISLFADCIEHAESKPRSVRLVMAMSLLAEILLMVGQRQTLLDTNI